MANLRNNCTFCVFYNAEQFYCQRREQKVGDLRSFFSKCLIRNNDCFVMAPIPWVELIDG
jgi:hypothetical protein